MNILRFIKDILFAEEIILPKANQLIKDKKILVQGPQEKYPKSYSIREFENLFNINYFAGLGFKNQSTLNAVKHECQLALQSQFLNKEVLWLGALYSKEIDSGFVNDVYIKWIDEHIGFGLYANKDFHKNALIGEYSGLVRRYFPLWSNCNPYCYRYATSKFSNKLFTIDASYNGNEIRFINHSNHPNCESVVASHNGLFHTCIRTNKEISRGTQLCYDYGNDYLRKENELPDI